MTILTSNNIWEKLDKKQEKVILYLDGTIGIIKDEEIKTEIEETNLLWNAISNNTIAIIEKKEN